MTKIISRSVLALALVFALGAVSAAQVHAQASSTIGTMMPTFYNQYGSPMNTGTGTLAPGLYYTGTGGAGAIYYYGNGVFYDPASGTYWRSNAGTGTVGGTLTNLGPNYNPGIPTTSGTVPGVPNTGAGGQAATSWFLLAGLLAGTVAFAGASHAVMKRTDSN